MNYVEFCRAVWYSATTFIFLHPNVMAMSLNRVQLIGNVTKDPEVRQIPGGANVATFSIATNYSWKDQAGARQDKAEFHNVVAWRKLGEIAASYVKRGNKVFAEGRLQTREWEGPDGQKRYKTEIILDNLILLDKKGTGSAEGSEGEAVYDSERSHSSVRPSASQNVDVEESINIEDLPF